jgi:tetratricopeptide (TPR) repeat protein
MSLVATLRHSVRRLLGRRWTPSRLDWPPERAEPLLRFPVVAAQLELHYVENNAKGFESICADARLTLERLPAVRQRQYRFMLLALEGNMHLRARKSDEAVAAYRQAIAEVAPRLQGILVDIDVKDTRNQTFFSVVLALLYANLGDILSGDKEKTDQATAEYQRAIRLLPGMSYIRQRLAEHYSRHGKWDEALEAYRDLYRCVPSEENAEHLLANLASVYCEQARALKDESRYGEALQVLRQAAAEVGSKQVGWQGRIHFLRAECLVGLGRTGDALTAYAESGACYERAKLFPSASYLSETGADLHAKSSADRLARKMYEAALAYADQITADPDLGEEPKTTRTRRGRLCAKLFLLALARGDDAEADRMFAAARDAVPPEEWWNPYERIVTQAGKLLDRDDLAAALKCRLTELVWSAGDERARREMIIALRALYDKSERLITWDYQVAFRSPDYPTLNVMTPIAIEIDAETLRRCGDQGEIETTYGPAMRERVQQAYGIAIPGVRYRENATDLSTGAYSIMIHEIPVVTGTVRPERFAYVGPESGLTKLGLKVDDATLAPFAGEGYWVDAAAAEKLRAAGHTLWKPLDYLLRHVEAIVVANLVEFVGHQEVQNLLERAGLIATDRYDELLYRESGRHIDVFSNVVRCLVAERVPMTSFAEVHRLFLDGLERRQPVHEIVTTIRAAEVVRDRLWGNDATYAHYQLGPNILRHIDAAQCGPGQRVLAFEPEVIQEILTAIRDQIGDRDRAAIVVPGGPRRALARALVEIEFPDVPVLSLRELRPGLWEHVAGTIDVVAANPLVPAKVP